MDISQTLILVYPKILTCSSFLLNLIFLIFSNGCLFAYFCTGALFFDFIITLYIYSGINQRKFKIYVKSIVFLLLKTISGTLARIFLSVFSEEGKKYFIFSIVAIIFSWLELLLLSLKVFNMKMILD